MPMCISTLLLRLYSCFRWKLRLRGSNKEPSINHTIKDISKIKNGNNIESIKIEIYCVMLMITGILFVSVFHPEDTKSTILSGMDEPIGNAYEDPYVAEEENVTSLSRINQTMNENNTRFQIKVKGSDCH